MLHPRTLAPHAWHLAALPPKTGWCPLALAWAICVVSLHGSRHTFICACLRPPCLVCLPRVWHHSIRPSALIWWRSLRDWSGSSRRAARLARPVRRTSCPGGPYSVGWVAAYSRSRCWMWVWMSAISRTLRLYVAVTASSSVWLRTPLVAASSARRFRSHSRSEPPAARFCSCVRWAFASVFL